MLENGVRWNEWRKKIGYVYKRRTDRKNRKDFVREVCAIGQQKGAEGGYLRKTRLLS